MLIKYSLKGSKGDHIGVFDSTGFWARFEPEMDMDVVQGYKIYSHFSFAYYHEDKAIAMEVYEGLINTLTGDHFENPQIGFIEIISS